MKIDVTKQHIAAGKKSYAKKDSERTCPVANGIHAATGRPCSVGYDSCFFDSPEGVVGGEKVSLPPEVRQRIWDYDASGRMEPFTFELPIREKRP